jgi:hypothetical protein
MKADGGGWTLALKIDGTQSTFAYASALWTDDTLLAPESTDLSTTEAKHASFVRLPTSELRVAMLTGGVMRAIHFPLVRPSLKDAFAGGRLATSIGRSAWLSLLDAPALQPNCNDEGFDIDYTAAGPYPRVRLGIVGNDQSDCGSPDSYLGIGAEFITTHPCFGPNVEVVVGNVARKGCFGVTEDRTITAFAYVFVR